MTALPQRGGAIAECLICRAEQHDPDKVSFAEVITVNEFNEYVRESFSTAGDILMKVQKHGCTYSTNLRMRN